MKGLRVTCLVLIVITLSGTLSVNAYSSEHNNQEDQWGGIGHNHQDNSGWSRPTENPTPTGQQTSNRYEKGNSQKSNQFSKETHVERYGYPPSCVHESHPQSVCNYFVEIAKEPEDSHNLHFELSYHIPDPTKGGYVAIGLSKDRQMGEDHMVECVLLADGTTRAYHSWAAGKRTPTRLIDDHSVFEMEDKYPQYEPEDRLLTCRFRRPIITHIQFQDKQPIKFDLQRDKYYVLLAVGPTGGSNSDKLGYHGDRPLESGNAYASRSLLGYSNESFPSSGSGTSGHHGVWTDGNSGNAMGSDVVILFFFPFIMLFY